MRCIEVCGSKLLTCEKQHKGSSTFAEPFAFANTETIEKELLFSFTKQGAFTGEID